MLTQDFNFVHVDDVAEDIFYLKNGKIGERYILGGENLDFKKFLDMISEVAGSKSKNKAIKSIFIRLLSK